MGQNWNIPEGLRGGGGGLKQKTLHPRGVDVILLKQHIS